MKDQKLKLDAAYLLVRYYNFNDEDALTEFFHQYKNLAFRIAFNVLGNSEDAEDVIQQAFLQILNKKALCKAAFEGDSYKVKSWLLAIIYNISNGLINMKSKNKTINYPEDLEDLDIEKEPVTEKEKILTEINTAIFDLPEKYRSAILMRYHQEMSIEEISKVLNIKQNTIRSILSRGISILKMKMSKHGTTVSSVVMLDIISTITYPTVNIETSFNIIKKVRQSNRFNITQPQNVKHKYFKIILIFSLLPLAALIYYFSINNTVQHSKTLNQSLPTTVTNKTKLEWDFSKENGYDLKTIQGNIKYLANENSITNIDEKLATIVQLPNHYTKPIQISIKCKVILNEQIKQNFYSLEFIPIIYAKGQTQTRVFNSPIPISAKEEKNYSEVSYIQNFYIFQNHSVLKINDQIVKVFKYENLSEDTTLGILLQNFYIEKINLEYINPENIKLIEDQLHKLIRNK